MKLALGDGRLTLTVNNPDSGSATEETRGRLRCGADRYRLQRPLSARHRGQLDGDTAVFKLADPGSPTIDPGPRGAAALYVLMPMRV